MKPNVFIPNECPAYSHFSHTPFGTTNTDEIPNSTVLPIILTNQLLFEGKKNIIN